VPWWSTRPRALVYLTARDRENGYRWPESGPPYPDSVLVASWALVLSPAAARDGTAGTRLHLRLRINRVGKRAPWLVARLGGLIRRGHRPPAVRRPGRAPPLNPPCAALRSVL
jgi:hypothetical protein